LEFDDLTKIIKDPTRPLPEQEFSWAFDIVNNTMPPILLTQLTNNKNNSFLKYVATSLKKVSDLKDYHGGEHSERVKILSLMVGKALQNEGKFSKKDLSNLELAAMLHDIGKLAIPEKILRKRGKLNEEERQIIEKHPTNSVKILLSMRHFDNLVPFVLSHHENFDGTGYPRHLSGESIPLISRIIRIADAFDAMAYGRPYQSLIQKKEAIQEIKKYSGKNKKIQFDPYLSNLFIKVVQTI
jgi:HD-GYP domain-containing protein (c-di-GMP phosphodiesterase class II)